METIFDQRSLVNVIRSVHEKLRNDCKKAENEDEIWTKHKGDVELRKKYAEAMRKLATNFWEANSPNSRIEWCRRTWRKYYFQGGLEKCLLKDRRLNNKHGLCSVVEDYETFDSVKNKLELLDVGSCYNPFGQDEDCRCLAIDITPATEDVFECDFLNVPVILPMNHPPKQNGRTIEALPADTFHVVIFSLVLEYLPSATQRWRFCRKARDVLRPDGLLLIVTPDSKSQHKNAPMMCSWREAVARIGLQRITYEKLQHLHCMAFRKLPDTGFCIPDVCPTTDSELLYIPQDFNSCPNERIEKKMVEERTEMEEKAVSDCFMELPLESDLFR